MTQSKMNADLVVLNEERRLELLEYIRHTKKVFDDWMMGGEIYMNPERRPIIEAGALALSLIQFVLRGDDEHAKYFLERIIERLGNSFTPPDAQLCAQYAALLDALQRR